MSQCQEALADFGGDVISTRVLRFLPVRLLETAHRRLLALRPGGGHREYDGKRLVRSYLWKGWRYPLHPEGYSMPKDSLRNSGRKPIGCTVQVK